MLRQDLRLHPHEIFLQSQVEDLFQHQRPQTQVPEAAAHKDANLADMLGGMLAPMEGGVRNDPVGFQVHRHQGQHLPVVEVVNPVIDQLHVLDVLLQEPDILFRGLLKHLNQRFPVLFVEETEHHPLAVLQGGELSVRDVIDHCGPQKGISA
jgi:hypothetical protein